MVRINGLYGDFLKWWYPITSLHLRVPDGISTGGWVCLVKSVMIYGGEPLQWWVSPTISMGFPTKKDQHLGWRLGKPTI